MQISGFFRSAVWKTLNVDNGFLRNIVTGGNLINGVIVPLQHKAS